MEDRDPRNSVQMWLSRNGLTVKKYADRLALDLFNKETGELVLTIPSELLIQHTTPSGLQAAIEALLQEHGYHTKTHS